MLLGCIRVKVLKEVTTTPLIKRKAVSRQHLSSEDLNDIDAKPFKVLNDPS